MDTDVEFSFNEWDEFSDTSTIHLSYLIQNLLPIRLVGWKAVRRHYDSVMSGIPRTDDASDASDDTTCIVTGSTAEGFGIPNCMTRTTPPVVERFSDIDMLMVYNDLLISTTELSIPNESEYKAYFDSKGLHPGYTRLCLPSFKNMDDAFILDEETNKYYFSGTKCIERLSSKKFDVEPTESVWIQGPALTIEDNQVLTKENFIKMNAGMSRDIVIALRCTPWPQEADAWKERALKSQWPTPDIVQSILEDGCHVVAVPSKNSLKPELEWRMSFSASEGKLAREAVTDHQRQCYIYLKILRYQMMKPVSVLSSYVFKSVFLHCCEKLPVDNWKKSPGNCIIYMLDVILDCLRKKCVPTYFLPENNLVDHLTAEELDAAILAVETLRADPITPVLDFTDKRVVGMQSIMVNLRELVKPLLEDMKLFKVHRNKQMSVLCGIMHTGIYICQFLLHETSANNEIELTKHQEAVRVMIDIFQQWLSPMDLNASLIQYINTAGLTIKNLQCCIRFFQAVLSLSSGYPEFSSVRGNLACMYHSFAYPDGDDENPEPNAEHIKKAGELFEQFYAENKVSAIDYVAYLVKLKDFTKAEHILEDFIDHLDGFIMSSYTYDKKEINTLENPLKQHVADNGTLSGDAISFAYYYLVRCAIEVESDTSSEKIKGILEKFENYCENRNDENARLLLAYAKTISKMQQDE